MSRSATIFICALWVSFLASTFTSSAGQNPAKKNPAAPQFPEAPVGFDNGSNGMVDDRTHLADQERFDRVESVADGLGPLYNAQSCRECHQNPTSGGGSQMTELRVGHLGSGH